VDQERQRTIHFRRSRLQVLAKCLPLLFGAIRLTRLLQPGYRRSSTVTHPRAPALPVFSNKHRPFPPLNLRSRSRNLFPLLVSGRKFVNPAMNIGSFTLCVTYQGCFLPFSSDRSYHPPLGMITRPSEHVAEVPSCSALFHSGRISMVSSSQRLRSVFNSPS
jgi:hypothetical protein